MIKRIRCEDELDRLRAHARRLEALVHQQHQELLVAEEATAFSSHDDTCGYRVCCQVPSYRPHKKSCKLPVILAAYVALEKEIEK